MAVVYQHTRKDTNQVFYIGIGKSNKRAYHKLRRNKYWANIFNKTEVEVKILCEDIDVQLAYDIEKYLISYYGRFDLGLGSLVNMTNGGEAFSGYVFTEKDKAKMSIAKIGKKRECLSGDKHFMFGKTHTNEYKAKMSQKLIEVKGTDKNKEKVSKQFKGTKQSAEHIAKRVASMPKSFKKINCPYCNTVGGGSNMVRYHFDKCKQKK
jgi:hypothetical protein